MEKIISKNFYKSEASFELENFDKFFKYKQELRKIIKAERKNLDIDKISQTLVEKLQKTAEYEQAQNIMIFYPLKYEINLLGLLEDKTKNFYLPRIEGEDLLCCPYFEVSELCESCFKTKEPQTTPVKKSMIDLVIVPALAVDKNNYRLGYGGGFYDRFLKDFEGVKVTCLSKEFILDTVYPEVHDIKIDIVVIT